MLLHWTKEKWRKNNTQTTNDQMTRECKHDNTGYELPIGGFDYGAMLYNGACNACYYKCAQ